MKVAILGANGQLGTDLVEIFKELRPEVVINTAAYVRVDDAEVEVEKNLSSQCDWRFERCKSV